MPWTGPLRIRAALALRREGDREDLRLRVGHRHQLALDAENIRVRRPGCRLQERDRERRRAPRRGAAPRDRLRGSGGQIGDDPRGQAEGYMCRRPGQKLRGIGRVA